MREFTENDFTKEVLQSDIPVLVYFWAGWCAPCKIFSKVVEEIASEHQEFKVGKVNVQTFIQPSKDYHISSVPTLVLIKNGEAQVSIVGVKTKNAIINQINKYL